MTEIKSERDMIVSWFETSFRDAAKQTTKTSRLEDGRLSYSFSVVNDSGLDFDKFSFKIKVINKANGSDLGTATIRAGKWAKGEKKNFRSKLSIPADVKSLSFVMYSNSLEYEAAGNNSSGNIDDMINTAGDTIKEIGDSVFGSGGEIFGELFGTGGMPATEQRPAQTASQKSGVNKPAGTSAGSGSGSVQNRPAGGAPAYQPQRSSFAKRRNEKKLNKKRLGKSGWTAVLVSAGTLFLMTAALSTDDPNFRIGAGVLGALFMGAAGILKLVLNKKAKLIRTYEAKINKNGNTSIDELCEYAGKSFNQVADDLQQMIVDGFFDEAYVDIDNRLLVMTQGGRPIESVEKSAAINNKARRKAGKDKNAAPETLDDLITMTDDPEIKSKLKSLRTITKKIDMRVEEVPELEKQVKDFREKYYPEVVRLTDDYNDKIADMGRTPVTPKEEVTQDASGAPVLNTNPNYLEEQAAEIKSQLISLIDSVTEASENLLERLHEDDIMDITTDIKMLQTTLASKGLLDSDFDIK